MATICPQCSLENPDQSAFCARCGSKLTQNFNPANGGPSQLYSTSSESMAQNFPVPPASAAAPSSAPFQQMPPPTMYTPPNTAPPQPAVPLSRQLGRRAFAGYGMPVSRASWLIADQQAQAMPLLTAARDALNLCGLPGLSINEARLTERSFLLESRDYLTAHRGSSTVFVYVAPAGRDLYLSRTTTMQTPVSFTRVAIFILLLILMIFGLALRGSPGGAISDILVFFSYPLLVFFLALVVASLFAWLIYGDVGMFLRSASMNDFQADDAALVEETIDSSLRSAAQKAGLDPVKITAPSPRHQALRRIRAI